MEKQILIATVIFNNLNIETLKSDAENFSIPDTDSYAESYPVFIKYFKEIEIIDKHHLIIASHFVYGWMPTIIHLNTDSIDLILDLLNDAKSGKILNPEQLSILKKSINNSMVGLSKLLHFISPQVYAIWDSRIYRYLTGKKTPSGINKPDLYSEYLKAIKKLIKHPDFVIIQEKVEEELGYSVSPLRAIDLIMYESNKKNSSIL